MTVAMEVARPLMDGEKISPRRVRVTTQLKPREKKKRVMPMSGRYDRNDSEAFPSSVVSKKLAPWGQC
jgi:hypothetical protein